MSRGNLPATHPPAANDPDPLPDGLRPGAVRSFRIWLLVLIGLVLVMVTVGGATRLTGSGLSITEWKPVLGAIPPFGGADWAREFALYKASPQYQLLNSGMSLSEFKFIYWWEWGHRQLGRFIGLVMLGGFLAFFLTGAIRGRFAALTFGLGLLLGLQGAIGWIMVASGLKPGMIAVAPVKLTLHLVFACLYFAGLVAMATRVGAFGPQRRASPGLRRAAWALVVAILVQIALGGLVAGSRAGFTYNTWPLMDGALVPAAAKLFVVPAFWENFVDNPTLVQFNHRLGAYILLALSIWHALAARGTATAWGAKHLAYAVAGQGVLGIVTLLLVVPLWAGLAHQALALLVLMSAVLHAAKMRLP
ncbi:MAG: cytochrome c oxidase assembly protein subunit [Beijerinckiaceae bacterium]|nr:MAG: cytochrome c oxidase assembly protein subunit [Beijerinckiaceae bacterium]